MNSEEEPPLKRFLLTALCLALLALPAYAAQAPEAVVVGQSYFRAYSAIEEFDTFRRLEYRTIIKCLAFYESGYNQDARGAAGEIGMMQFMPSTFDQYCEGSIYVARDQAVCADEMLQVDWANRFHWTTISSCVN